VGGGPAAGDIEKKLTIRLKRNKKPRSLESPRCQLLNLAAKRPATFVSMSPGACANKGEDRPEVNPINHVGCPSFEKYVSVSTQRTHMQERKGAKRKSVRGLRDSTKVWMNNQKKCRRQRGGKGAQITKGGEVKNGFPIIGAKTTIFTAPNWRAV